MTCSARANVDVMEVVVGADETFTITVLDSAGNPFDLTGSKIFFSVKKKWRDDLPVIAKATTNGGGADDQILMLTQTGDTKGKAQLFIEPGDTLQFSDDEVDGSQWVYDVWLINTAGKKKVVRKMRPFVLEPRVTEVP